MAVSFIGSLISYLLVFFVFIIAVVAAVIIGVTIGRNRARKIEAEAVNPDEEYSDTAMEEIK